jgi:hypothetical protein
MRIMVGQAERRSRLYDRYERPQSTGSRFARQNKQKQNSSKRRLPCLREASHILSSSNFIVVVKEDSDA